MKNNLTYVFIERKLKLINHWAVYLINSLFGKLQVEGNPVRQDLKEWATMVTQVLLHVSIAMAGLDHLGFIIPCNKCLLSWLVFCVTFKWSQSTLAGITVIQRL